MVEKIQKNKVYFKCKECNYVYLDMKWAKKCEAWCKKHRSCNLEETKHAVEI